MKSCRNQRRKQ